MSAEVAITGTETTTAPPRLTGHKIGGANMFQLDEVGNLARYLLDEAGEQPILVVSAFKEDKESQPGKKQIGVTDLLLKALDDLDGKDFTETDIAAALLPAKEFNIKVIEMRFKKADKKTQAIECVNNHFNDIKKALLVHREKTNRLAPDEATYVIRDRVVGAGEDIARDVTKYFLEENGIEAETINDVTAEKIEGNGQVTRTALHRAIRTGIHRAVTPHIAIPAKKVLIMGGHVRGTRRGMLQEIGRNYSDPTAMDLAIVLQDTRRRLEEFSFQKDVDGVKTGNPDEVSPYETMLITDLSHEEGVELGAAGSELLHPHALVEAAQYGVRLRVRNIKKPQSPGTTIDATTIETTLPFKIVATQPCDVIGFRCPNMAIQSGFIEAFGAVLHKHGISIADPLSRGGKVQFTIPLPKDASALTQLRSKLKKVCDECKRIKIDDEEYDIEVGWGQARYGNVSIIGKELKTQAGFMGELGSLMAAYNINIDALSQETDQVTVSLYVHENDRKTAARLIHAYFINKDPEVHRTVEKRKLEIAARYQPNPK